MLFKPASVREVRAARLKALFQRTPVPVEPHTEGSVNGIPAKWIPATSGGHEYKLVGYRWLTPDEE